MKDPSSLGSETLTRDSDLGQSFSASRIVPEVGPEGRTATERLAEPADCRVV